MLQLTATLKTSGAFGRELNERIARLNRMERNARTQAATKATTVSQNNFGYLRPPNAPPRPGRSSNQGQTKQMVRWVSGSTSDEAVRLDVDELDRRAPHWIINEIGTGQRAVLRKGRPATPRGGTRVRASQSGTTVRTVKAQRGRPISSSLVFATGPRGTYSPPGSATGQQLYLRRQIKKAPVWVATARRQLRITREIQAKHFAQRGGETGYRAYRTEVLAAAQQAFAGRPWRP